jgi:hypothetical protein
MKLVDPWARRFKRRLERAGFKVTMLDPALSGEAKKAARRRDRDLLASGEVSPEELQRRNSIFKGNANRFRIVNYGGLDED